MYTQKLPGESIQITKKNVCSTYEKYVYVYYKFLEGERKDGKAWEREKNKEWLSRVGWMEFVE